MNDPNTPQKATSSTTTAILIAMCFILASALISVIGIYWILPALGIVIAFSAGAWGVLIASVVVLTIALLLFFIIPFIFVILLSLLSLMGAIIAIVFFPILFPIVVPLLILLMVIGYLRRHKNS